MDEQIKRVAIAICQSEHGSIPPNGQCKTCRNAHYVFDKYVDIGEGCLGLGYEYLAEIAVKAADRV